MRGKAVFLLVILAMLALSGFTVSAAQKNVGSTIKVPQGASVEMHGKSGVTVKGVGGLGISGTFNCLCSGGHFGECVVEMNGSQLVCKSSATDKCTAGCWFSTTTTGAQ